MASRRRRRFLLVLVAPAFLVACIVSVSNGVRARSLDKSARNYEVTSPVKAHLLDGSTVVYPGGIVVLPGTIAARRDARRTSATYQPMVVPPEISLDSVVGLESYHTDHNEVGSIALSTLASAGGFVLSVATAIAIFGSCPTIYADSAGTQALQAEVFATRISPLLEARDIDLLSTRPNASGVLMLDVRNEALETHYINHFELLEIRHRRDQRLIPDEHGRPLLIGALRAPATARDRMGRDVTGTLTRHDRDVFASDSLALARASGADPFDHIDVTFPSPAGDSVVVGLHLRNSLLNTVLLYEMMLANPGARSLDWIARDMRRIGPMFQFGRWYREHFGLRVSVFDGTKYRDVERHPTYGPVAWREAATVVPVLQRDSVRVRLTFAADEWRIEWVGLADAFSRPRPVIHRIDHVRTTTDSVAAITLRNLRSADDRYVQTSPGERFWVGFRPHPAPAGDSTQSFLLASQGYYTEWIRGSWVKQATDSVTFKPGPAALDQVFQRWHAKRDSIATAFFATRIPLRLP